MSSNHLKDNRRHNVVTASQGYDIIDKQVPKWEEYTLLKPPFQVQLQCFTHGTPYGWFGVWTPEEFHAEKIVYDQEFIDWYLPYAHQFLEYVETNTKPSRWKKKPVYQPKEK